MTSSQNQVVDIGTTPLIFMDIDTANSPPVSLRPYTLPLKHHAWIKIEIEMLEDAGVICKSFSPWASPIVVISKKSEKEEPMKRRMCVDFQKINALQPEAITINKKNKGNLSLPPLPKIDQMYGKLKGAKFFTTLDLCSGYYHITLAPDTRVKTAFVTKFGKYEFNKIPFRLAQALAYIQELIRKVIGNIPYAMGYLGDIIISSNSEEEHLQHISDIFEKLHKAELKLKL